MSVASLKQHVVPYFAPTIGEEEIASVVETLRSGWLTTGPKVKQFEQEFAARVQAQHAVAVSSCTAALHLALEAIGIGEGDEVLLPTLTFASTAAVVVHLGGVPVLVDCREDTLTMDPDQLEGRITDRTKEIIPVHYGGQPCDMDRIQAIAEKHGLKVIEDAAHAIPSRFHDRPIGSIGDISCFSFYANKTITTGEGGMITTDDADLADRMRIMSLHGISKDAWKRYSAAGAWYYEISAPGYKSNMTDISAALGIHQLARCEEFFAKRQRIARAYDEAFADLEEIETPFVEFNVVNSWHLYVVRLNLPLLTIGRGEFIDELKQAGVGTSVHYMPLHLHPYYQQSFKYRDDDFPVARAAYQRMISLPIYPKMSDFDVRYVAEQVTRLIRRYAVNNSRPESKKAS